jgi:hypothetical protein
MHIRTDVGVTPGSFRHDACFIPARKSSLNCAGRNVIELPPGKHTLQLILGDMVHVPRESPVISQAITITAK